MLVRMDDGRLRWHWDPRLLERIAADGVNQQQRLLAGGEREQPLAAEVLVEVEELAIAIDQRAERTGPIEQDDPLPERGGIRPGGRHTRIDHHADPRRLVAFEAARPILLPHRVALGNHRGPADDDGGWCVEPSFGTGDRGVP